MGFDVISPNLFQVKYTNKRITFDPDASYEDKVRQLLSTKFASWRYEKEFRLYFKLKGLVPQEGLYFRPLGHQLILREIIFGANYSGEIPIIRDFIEKYDNSISVFKSRLAHNSFNVVPNHRTVVCPAGLTAT